MKRPPYWLLFLVQTLGAIVILSIGVPYYRQALLRTEARQPIGIFLLVSTCVVVIQASYWLGFRGFPASRLGGQPVFGHILIFVSRLCFVFVSSLFCVVYFVRFGEIDARPGGFVLLTFVLFSLFCYARELERLGTALLGPPPERQAPP